MASDDHSVPNRGIVEAMLSPLLVIGVGSVALGLSALSLGAPSGLGDVDGPSLPRRTLSTLMMLAEKNHILQAFIASSVLGLISYAMMLLSRSVLSKLRGRMFCSVTINNSDENFKQVVDYIAKHNLVCSGCLVATTHKKNKTWKDWRTEFLMGERQAPRMDYAPANNNDVHWIHYKGAQILMHRNKGETVVTGWERVPMQMETLVLSSWGSHVGPLKALINDALHDSFEQQRDEMTVFVMADLWTGGWEKALSKKPRTVDSVILDENLANELIADARDFLGASDWYAGVGIPYRRGYLLHGPPGCGKTSFCQALAGALKLDICMLTLTNKRLDDNKLAECLRDAPTNAIVLLEDVDAVFVDRTVQNENRQSGVTFSGLLNALDGVASQEGRLFFMTTNHIEKLDPALIRPGRCDVKVEVRRASRSQAHRLFSRFFEGATDEDARAFADALPEYELSMAQLQGYLLEHKKDPAGALTHAQQLLRSSKPLNVDRMPIADHLRRVGLEGWAPTFIHHGYSFRADLRGVSIETVKSWSGFLRIDALACKRMELLLAENDSLMAEYQLVDMSTAKDLFLAAFTPETEPPAVATPDRPPLCDASAAAVNIDDGGAIVATTEGKRAAVSATSKATISQLADRFCAAIQRNGKSAASVWQVRRHLHLHGHSAEAAISTAVVLIETLVLSDAGAGAGASRVDDLGTYDFLRRAGLEKHAKALEVAGYCTARSLYGLSEDTLKDDCEIKDAIERKQLHRLFNADGADARMLLAFTSPDYARIRAAALTAFAKMDAGTSRFTREAMAAPLRATELAKVLCDRAGHGLISLGQLERFLDGLHKFGSADEVVEAARAELLNHSRPVEAVEPAPEKPDAWVYGWLVEHQLESYAEAFIDNKLETKEDLQLEPRLDMMALAKMGVEKAGDARRLLNLIKHL